MAVSLVKGTLGSNAVQWTEGALILAVSSGGSNTATVARPTKLVAGDYSATPFLTPQAAIDAIPKGLNADVTIRIGAGTFAGFVAHGFVGMGRLRIAGSKALASVTTGVNTGTANTGTTSTSLVKPGAAANWTASDLRGKHLVITSGGGASSDPDFPTIRPIKANTTTAISVDPINGMDNTSVFQIVDAATVLTTATPQPQGIQMRAGILWCQAKVDATLLSVNETGGWYGLLVWNSQSVNVSGCTLAASSGFAAGAISSTEVYVDNCILNGIYNPFVVEWMTMQNTVIQSGGRLSAQHITRGVVLADALSCTGTAIKIQDSVMISLAANLNSCAVTPLDLQNIHNFRIDGYLTGTNPTPTRGMVISRGGQYIITGATLAGSSSDEFEIEGRAGSYFELSGVNSGTYMSRGTFLHWGTGYTVLQTKFRVEGGEPGDDFDEFIINNGVIGGIIKHYGAWQSLDPAYKEITAHAGGGQGSATVVGFRDTRVHTVATAGDSVRLLSTGEIAYAGGLIGSVYNGASNNMDLFPPSGKKLYLNGNVDLGTNTALSVPPGANVIWLARNDQHYAIFVTPAYAVGGLSSVVGNTVPRWSGTTGRAIKSSNIVIEDGDQLHNYRAYRNRQTGTTYTLVAYDSGAIIEFTQGCTVTVPTDLFGDFCCTLVQVGGGQIEVVGDTGVDINNVDGHTKSAGQWAMCTLYRTADSGNQQFVFGGRTGV